MNKSICALVVSSGLSVFALPSYAVGQISDNSFNPAISVILDGRYTDIDHSELELPGFQLGGEAGLPENGFSTGHNELTLSANVDDLFYGETTAALIYEGGETEIELEEAFVETLGLGNGFTARGGRFFSDIGYLNNIHLHAHDFSDRPLVYDVLLGGHLVDSGVQLKWLAPTEFFLNFGVELTTGSEYPSGENEDNNKGGAFFVKTGGDFGKSSSWQLGASLFTSEFDAREAGGHHHGGHEHVEEVEIDNELLNGEVDIVGIDFVYKWAPNGNSKETNFKFQFEYFKREERGIAEFVEGDEAAEANYDGEQDGFYVQAVYQFMPRWRAGLRYDHIEASNTISNFESEGLELEEFLEESGLEAAENNPSKVSAMIDYSHSHFSRLRLQWSRLDDGSEESDMVTLQYIMSLGSHGAHTF